MVKAKKKTTRKQKVTAYEYRPYRVLFLVTVVAVTSLVLFLILSTTLDR